MGHGVNKAPSILVEGHGPKDLIGHKSTTIFELCKPKQRLIVHMSLQGTPPWNLQWAITACEEPASNKGNLW